MADSPFKLNRVDSQLLPREITGPIFQKATESSAVMSRARRIPLSLHGETTIPIPGDVPVAGWISEGARKPLGTSGVGLKTMSGKKVAVMVAFSEEVVKTNPAGMYEQLVSDLPTSIARAFDFATVHGKTVDGQPGPFANYLTQSSNVIDLSDTDAYTQGNGGIYKAFVDGSSEVLNAGYDYNGLVADPRLKPMLQLATDLNGRPLYVDTYGNTSGPSGDPTLNGVPVSYSKGVSGKVNRQADLTDTGLRAIGGDWDQVVYGVGMDITIKVSDNASFVDEDGNTHSAFQENLVLVLAEAYYGMLVNDPDAFVLYSDGEFSQPSA